MWPVISGQGNVSQSSTTGPRTEIPLSIANPIYQTSALIVGDHKLLVGSQTLGYWQVSAQPLGADSSDIGSARYKF